MTQLPTRWHPFVVPIVPFVDGFFRQLGFGWCHLAVLFVYQWIKALKYGTVAGYNCYRIGIEGYWRAIVPIDQIQEFDALLTTHLCLPLSRIEQTPHFCVNLLWCLGCMWRCRRQSVAETLLEGWWVDLWFQDELHTLMLHYLFKTHSKGDAFQWVSIIQISTWKTYFVDGWYYNKWYEIIVRKVCLCEKCQSDPMPFRH